MHRLADYGIAGHHPPAPPMLSCVVMCHVVSMLSCVVMCHVVSMLSCVVMSCAAMWQMLLQLSTLSMLQLPASVNLQQPTLSILQLPTSVNLRLAAWSRLVCSCSLQLPTVLMQQLGTLQLNSCHCGLLGRQIPDAVLNFVFQCVLAEDWGALSQCMLSLPASSMLQKASYVIVLSCSMDTV